MLRHTREGRLLQRDRCGLLAVRVLGWTGAKFAWLLHTHTYTQSHRGLGECAVRSKYTMRAEWGEAERGVPDERHRGRSTVRDDGKKIFTIKSINKRKPCDAHSEFSPVSSSVPFIFLCFPAFSPSCRFFFFFFLLF